MQDGDTLKSIAQAVYGNASLWYIVAQANALTGDSDLAAGLSLTIPAVTTTKNDATTFKPYNPGAIQGSTTPDLPVIAPPPPPPKQHCNVVAAIVVIAVTVVVSYFAGPVAGNLAGQLAGDAMGTHHGISLKEAAISYVASEVGAGVGQYVGETTGSTLAAGASSAAASYATTVVASKALDQDTHFSWAGLVASAAGGAAASQVGPLISEQVSGLSSAPALNSAASYLTQGAVTRVVSEALGDHHVQSWADIVGGAIGAGIGAAIRDDIVSYRLNQAVTTQDNRTLNAVSQANEVRFGSLAGGGGALELPDTNPFGDVEVGNFNDGSLPGGYGGDGLADVGRTVAGYGGPSGDDGDTGTGDYTANPHYSTIRNFVDPVAQEVPGDGRTAPSLDVGYSSTQRYDGNGQLIGNQAVVTLGGIQVTANSGPDVPVWDMISLSATRGAMSAGHYNSDPEGVRARQAIHVPAPTSPFAGRYALPRATPLPVVPYGGIGAVAQVDPSSLDNAYHVAPLDLDQARVPAGIPVAGNSNDATGDQLDVNAGAFAGESTSPWVFTEMGTGVGDVDWAGQPLTGIQSEGFSLTAKYGNVWRSDDGVGRKPLNYAILNRHNDILSPIATSPVTP